MPRLSQTLRFLQSPSFRQAQSALIGQQTQSSMIGRTPQGLVGNVTPMSIIASFSFQNTVNKTVNNVLSFTISSNLRWEQSRVRDTVMMLVCVCTQAAVVWLCLPLSQMRAHTYTHTMLRCDSLSLSLSHTHDAQNSAFEQSIVNNWTNTKTYSRWFRSARLSEQSQNYLLS